MQGAENIISSQTDIVKKNTEKFGFSWNEFLEDAKSVELLFGLFAPVNLLIGAGGEGKTLCAYHIAGKILRETDREIVYIDFDNPKSIVVDRGFSDFIVSNSYKDRVLYLNIDAYMLMREKQNIASIDRFIDYVLTNINDNSVVFFDSLQNFIDNVNDDNLSYRFFTRLRKYSNSKNLVFFVLHHISKTMGWAKGSTNITNMSDMAFMLKAVKEASVVKGWSLSEKKYRYKAPASIVLMSKNTFDFEIIDSSLNADDIKILRDIVSFLRHNIYSPQHKLVSHLMSKGYTKNKILDTIKTYPDLIKSFKDKSNKNTIRYYVNETSNYLKLINMQLDPLRLELISILSSISFDKISISTPNQTLSFSSPTLLKNAIATCSDDLLPYFHSSILNLLNDNDIVEF